MRGFWGLFFIGILISFGACNYRIEKMPLENSDTLNKISKDPANLSFIAVREYIFKPRCLICHGTRNDIDFNSYSNVKNRLGDIQRKALFEKSMPPNQPLNEGENNLLSAWIDIGAPEFGSGGTIPTPPPIDPLEPKYSSIRNVIFQNRCIVCHSPGQPAEKVPLNTLEDLLDSPRELIIPGNADDSGLIVALSRTDDKRMPPPQSGQPPLTFDEISIIKKWINDGAQP